MTTPASSPPPDVAAALAASAVRVARNLLAKGCDVGRVRQQIAVALLCRRRTAAQLAGALAHSAVEAAQAELRRRERGSGAVR